MRNLILILAVWAGGMLGVTGCSSLKIVEGSLTPPKWVADPSTVTNHNPETFIYASGISTYSSILEDGIADARHDAIRKIAELVGVVADDVYRANRADKRGTTQVNMPNVPQMIGNSHRAARAGSSQETKNTRTPQATHTSQTRLHQVDEAVLSYSVWQYGPSWWARLWYGDTAIRFYDVYVLLRYPKTEFDNALKKERAMDDTPDQMLPESKPADGN
jgi:hypothetical protein